MPADATKAEADVGSIWRYTARTWSVDQAEAYVASFESSFHLLLGTPEIAREQAAGRLPRSAGHSDAVLKLFQLIALRWLY
ncbi:type II toxin-antitoxin system RelE/ParE family toxin [Aurantimonas sp. C2-3-R2]|uniref:type II toxin-antitoxin system RelE/ParE family toxin n=1 Tax=unclassified Aurantimonas TaxID=2638230 RepID=UPI003FA43001